MSLPERLFQLTAHGTTVRTELLAGLTTFLTMSYIVFVNPAILGTTGMDPGAVFVATCLAAALGSAVMALMANFPVGMAPGMGLNAFFAFTVVGANGLPWQQALAAVLISGIVFLLLSLTGFFTAAFFLSRSYVVILYLLVALVVGHYTRMRATYPSLPVFSLEKDLIRWPSYAVIGVIGLYLTVKVLLALA